MSMISAGAKLSPNFETALRTLALARLSRETSQSVPANFEPVAYDRVILSGAGGGPSLDTLARGSALSTLEIATQLGPVVLAQLARQAALDTLDSALERAVNQQALESVEIRDLSTDPRLQKIWRHIAPALSRPIPSPVVVPGEGIDLGGAVGSQVMMNLPESVHSDEAWFVAAHEIAHAEKGHWFQGKALDMAERWFNGGGATVAEAFTAAHRELELEADRAAIAMVAEKLTDPERLIWTVMNTSAGREHPDGLVRAQSLCEALAQNGVTISPEAWSRAVQATESRRERDRRGEEKERSIAWDRFC